MKRHHHGPRHGISTESLSFTEVEVSGNEDETVERLTTLLSVEARICPEPIGLCLRIQQWALISATEREMMLSKTKFVMICDHITARSPELIRLIQLKLKSGRTDLDLRADSNTLKCRYCNTDYQVEIKEIGGQESALVITKWLDLGPGWTPMDTRWRVHLSRDKAAEIGTLGEAGDIRRPFESQPGPSQDALSCQNASYLTADGFKSAMDRLYDRTWILQAGKRHPLYYHDRMFFAAMIILVTFYIGLAAWDLSSGAR